MSTAPFISRVAISDNNRLIAQGATETIGLEVRNNGVWQPRSLIDSDHIPILTLYDSLGIAQVDCAPMTHFAVGRYIYNHRTLHTHTVGQWTLRITVEHSGAIAKLDDVGIFYLVSSRFDVYSVFRINDQTGKTWYWYIDIAKQAVSAVAQPLDSITIVEIINVGNPPEWIRFLNTEGNIRYMYPLITGEFYIDVIPPLAGEEWGDSPVFIGLDCQKYILSGDVLDQLLVIPLEE